VRGEHLDFEELADFRLPGVGTVNELALKAGIESVHLQWQDKSVAPAAVDVSASGPLTIRFAAGESDGVILAVGADPDRMRWAVDLARDQGAKRVGAYVNLATHHDGKVALQMVRSLVAPFARFSVMDGKVRTPADEASRLSLEALHAAYDMRGHGVGTTAHAAALDPVFVGRFGIAGTPDYCVRRLDQLCELGLDQLVIVGPTALEGKEDVAISRPLFNEHVLARVGAA
jgi:5,10-methylenetetrahydromethanopterin reductase